VGGIEDLWMLVHSGGFGTLGSFVENELDSQVAMVRVHDEAAVRLTHAALPVMLARGHGAIVHLSSIAAWTGAAGSVTYSASKAFLNVFCEGLHAEVGSRGIHVQSLCPGFTVTEFHDTDRFRGFKRSAIPRMFWMSADDVVAQSLHALTSSDQVIVVPGVKNRLYTELARYGSVRSVGRKLASRLRRGATVERG